MVNHFTRAGKKIISYLLFILLAYTAQGQTDIDGLMMSKKNICFGPAYMYSSWTNYWEGTLKRDNANLGKVTTQSVSLMGNYGITDKLNVLFMAPYVFTKASQGTLHGQQGFQDMSLWLKWMGYERKLKKGIIGVYAIGGYSFPLSNYVIDLMPLNIGLHSQVATARLMTDYQYNKFSFTASASYMRRSNVTLDRTSYYTTELHQTNEIKMPDAGQLNVRAGYRGSKLIAEGVFNMMRTFGGFDITRNNMPFPSNRMNASSAGVNFKWVLTTPERLSVTGMAMRTVSGRNMGEATTYSGGILYIIDFNKKKATVDPLSIKK
jgi:hypothetical protein